MTVAELFNAVGERGMIHACGPVLWEDRDRISDLPKCKGVYVVARTEDADSGCEPSGLPLDDSHFDCYHLSPDYERGRWLPFEPVLYIGQTTRGTIRERVRAFYCHKVGARSPHAGGQIIKLLDCDRWVYWATTNAPMDLEESMVSVFRKHCGQPPFGNATPGKPKRIRPSP